MRYLIALVPALVGAVVAVIGLVSMDDRQLSLSVALPGVALIVGAIVSLALVGALWAGRRRQARVVEAHASGLAQQRQVQDRFVARLDHEFKNPLTAMRAAVSNLDDSSSTDSSTVASLETQIVRLSRLTSDLRKLAEVRTVELELSTVSVSELVDDVVEALDDVDGRHDRTLTVSLPKAPRPLSDIRGDHDLLYLALFNVAANAVKYTHPGDTIEIRGTEDDAGVVLEIADTGIGIPVNEHEHVWEELARGHDALALPGAGLGLPFVKVIVERHGGTVSLRSRHGEGTSVRIVLPL